MVGIAPEHDLALFAAFIALPVAWCVLRVLSALQPRCACCFLERYAAASRVTRLCAALLLVTGAIHLALIPAHLQAEPGRAVLFAADGVLFMAFALLSVVVRRWRPWAAALLVATILAYLRDVHLGFEAVDQVGLISTVIEITALGLVLLPSPASHSGRRPGRWLITALVVLSMTMVTELSTWMVRSAQGMERRMPGMDAMAGMYMQPVPESITPRQSAAAVQLAEATKAGIARYANVAVAIADGYRPATPLGAPTIHYANAVQMRRGRLLDPRHPDELVYATTRHGLVLLGAMYMTHGLAQPGPDIGGALTDWHMHTNLCFVLGKWAIDGFVTPFGQCPVLSINVTTPAMLHVWTFDNPRGPYGELDPADLARVRNRR